MDPINSILHYKVKDLNHKNPDILDTFGMYKIWIQTKLFLHALSNSRELTEKRPIGHNPVFAKLRAGWATFKSIYI